MSGIKVYVYLRIGEPVVWPSQMMLKHLQLPGPSQTLCQKWTLMTLMKFMYLWTQRLPSGSPWIHLSILCKKALWKFCS